MVLRTRMIRAIATDTTIWEEAETTEVEGRAAVRILDAQAGVVAAVVVAGDFNIRAVRMVSVPVLEVVVEIQMRVEVLLVEVQAV